MAALPPPGPHAVVERGAMSAFDKIEKGVGNAVASAFSRFRSDLKPIEISSALKKALDEHAATMSRERTISPNVFLVSLDQTDYQKVVQWGEEALVEELTKSVTDYATEQDYAFLGPIRIRFQQTCGPVMAKGIEDTAFYRWFRLAGANEVGGHPQQLSITGGFGAFCGRISKAS